MSLYANKEYYVVYNKATRQYLIGNPTLYVDIGGGREFPDYRCCVSEDRKTAENILARYNEMVTRRIQDMEWYAAGRSDLLESDTITLNKLKALDLSLTLITEQIRTDIHPL